MSEHESEQDLSEADVAALDAEGRPQDDPEPSEVLEEAPAANEEPPEASSLANVERMAKSLLLADDSVTLLFGSRLNFALLLCLNLLRRRLRPHCHRQHRKHCQPAHSAYVLISVRAGYRNRRT